MAEYTIHCSKNQHSLPAADAIGVGKRDAKLLAQMIAAIAEGKAALAKIRAAESRATAAD